MRRSPLLGRAPFACAGECRLRATAVTYVPLWAPAVGLARLLACAESWVLGAALRIREKLRGIGGGCLERAGVIRYPRARCGGDTVLVSAVASHNKADSAANQHNRQSQLRTENR